mgnify:CR=1 FL=1
MKQRGAVLAKGRLLGLQFQALLEDGLYFDLARRANELAFRLRDGVAAWDIPSRWPPPPISSSRYCPMRRWQSSRDGL